MIHCKAAITLMATSLMAASISVCSGITDAASIQSNGGDIIRIDFANTFYKNTNHWQGYYGVILTNTSSVYNSSFNKPASSISTIQKFELDTDIREGDYLLITTSPMPPALSSLRAGDVSSIDSITGKGDESGTYTFTMRSEYRIPYTGDTILTDVPTIYTFVDSEQKSNHFREGLLIDENGTAVFAVPVSSSPACGYDGTSYYFQFMLPINSSNPLTYYIFYLPSDLPLESDTGMRGGSSSNGDGIGAEVKAQ